MVRRFLFNMSESRVLGYMQQVFALYLSHFITTNSKSESDPFRITGYIEVCTFNGV